MDKQGALYFKLLTGVFLLILAGYAIDHLWSREPTYELYSTQICEVGDGITVSGFVVRSESLLQARENLSFTLSEGQWVGGGQAVASLSGGSLVIPSGGYLSYTADGYEELLTPEFVLGCKEEDLEALRPREVPSNTAGRLIRSQNWYFAVPGNFPEFIRGDTLLLQIGDLKCEAKILRTQEILLLECNSYIHRITHLRQTEARLTTLTFPAVPLPGKAVYYEEGESCVYILLGAQARRRVVHILRIEGDQVWISPEDLPTGAQVILTEKEITDGMVPK